jgi:hypothetical protein
MRTRKKKGAVPCKDRARNSHKPKLQSSGLTDSTKHASLQAWEDFFARAAIGRPRRIKAILQARRGRMVRAA